MKENFDFYSKTNLKSYNLGESMRYQLGRLDSLDVFTREHCENVANVTCRLCEYLRLNQSFTIYCTMCAYLHDLGKLFIPSSILQKNGPLTDEEYETIKKHTTIGYEMCMDDKQLQPYAAGTIYHHEALNGLGYPNGLTQKEIPMEGQIIRVADEFDAIVSKRQYKSHIDISDTLKILIENSNPNPDKPVKDKKVAKLGKNNKLVVKALIKVVLDDTEYEISCIYDYVNYLSEQIERLEQIEKYNQKMDATKSDSKKNYYLEGMKILLAKGETLDNYLTVLQEYKAAYEIRKAKIDKLFKEVKTIKNLKV